MKEIKLTQGKFALVDDEDYEYLNQWKWYAYKTGDTFYARRTDNNNSCGILMHRTILNTAKGMEVDHKDHNGLNNQKTNIRNCTKSQNLVNRKSKGASKYMGVSIEKSGSHKGRIRAQIRVNGIVKVLGSYKTEEDAAIAYNESAIKYYGKFANLNIIKSGV